MHRQVYGDRADGIFPDLEVLQMEVPQMDPYSQMEALPPEMFECANALAAGAPPASPSATHDSMVAVTGLRMQGFLLT